MSEADGCGRICEEVLVYDKIRKYGRVAFQRTLHAGSTSRDAESMTVVYATARQDKRENWRRTRSL